MRKIKFRGKFLDDTSEWLYGNYVYIEDDVFHHKIADKSGLLLDIDINTLGQYTGLKDRNMKEIYEGDIVKSYYYIPNEDGTEGERYTIKTIKYDDVRCKYNIDMFENLEIIGNMWDNPELLEEGE